MHSKVTSNILDYRNPKTFEVGLSASTNFTELEILLMRDRMVDKKILSWVAFETNCLGDLLHSFDRILNQLIQSNSQHLCPFFDD